MDDTMFRLMQLKAKGYCCAQMILILGLEAQGRTNPDLVRSAGGLCFGINGSGEEVCGALSGGACLISLYAGRGADDETPGEGYLAMLGELVEWFREAGEKEYGGTRCGEILAEYPDRSICGKIVVDTYHECMDILTRHRIDPAAGKDG